MRYQHSFISLVLALGCSANSLATETLYATDRYGNAIHDRFGKCVTASVSGIPLEECSGVKKAAVKKKAVVVIEPKVAIMDSDNDGVTDNADQCANTPVSAVVDSQGCAQKLIIGNLNFANDQAELSYGSRTILDRAVHSIIANPIIEHITVTGYTDDRGAAAYNKSLSEKRAKSVANYLVSQGIDANKVSSAGMGMSNPIADNATSTGRRENRRVEIDLDLR